MILEARSSSTAKVIWPFWLHCLQVLPRDGEDTVAHASKCGEGARGEVEGAVAASWAHIGSLNGDGLARLCVLDL